MTPGGSPGSICAMRALTASMTCLRVDAGARDDDAADRLVRALDQRGHAKGVRRSARRPPARRRPARRSTRRRRSSSRHRPSRISPTPRTISQAPFDSSTLPPTLRLLSRTAATTALSGRLYGAQPIRIDVDLVLLDVAADRRDLGDAGNGVELIADEPVLQGAQLAQRVRGALDRVPEDVSDAGRVGAQRRRDALRAGSWSRDSCARARAHARSTDRRRPRRST